MGTEGKRRRGRPRDRETWPRSVDKERTQLGFRIWREAETAARDRRQIGEGELNDPITRGETEKLIR